MLQKMSLSDTVYQLVFNILACFVVQKGPALRQDSKRLRKVNNPDPGFLPDHDPEVLNDSSFGSRYVPFPNA
jgi:hypothetical protein